MTVSALRGTMGQSQEDETMVLKKLPYRLTICKVGTLSEIDLSDDFFFVEKTDEEISLVCRSEATPVGVTERSDGWRGFRIEGTLDFSLVGILSGISTILADNRIGIFAVSTFNTDYILVKEESFDKAMDVLEKNGYTIAE